MAIDGTALDAPSGGALDGRERILPSVGWNAAAQALPLVTTVVATPFLLDHLGVERYGIWVVVTTMLTMVTSLDGGVGVSLARFFALHHAADDRGAAARLIATAVGVAAGLGTFVTGLAFLCADRLVRILHVPPSRFTDAIALVHRLGVLAALVLMSAALIAVLAGHGRFRGVAGVNAIASLAYLVSLVAFVDGQGLAGVVRALEIQLLTVIVAAAWLVRGHLRPDHRVVVTASEARSLWRYATRMQVTLVTALVNTEADAVIVSSFVGLRAAAMFGIGYQAAMAVRVLPLWTLAPVFTRLSTRYGRDGDSGLVQEHETLNRTWQPAVAGYCAVGAVAAGFGVRAWLGPDYGRAAVVAALLLVGYAVNLVVTGVTACAVRAGGRPGIEARYAVVGALINAALTIPAALLLGLYGVVGATAAGTAVGALTLPWLVGRAGLPLRGLLSRPPVTAIAAGAAVTLAGELALASLPGHGIVRLAMAGLPALAGLAVFVALVARTGHIQVDGRSSSVALVRPPSAPGRSRP